MIPEKRCYSSINGSCFCNGCLARNNLYYFSNQVEFEIHYYKVIVCCGAMYNGANPFRYNTKI